MKLTFTDLAALLVTLLLWGVIGALLILGRTVDPQLWTAGTGALLYIFGRGQPGNIELKVKE
jgi:hypothetical protein